MAHNYNFQHAEAITSSFPQKLPESFDASFLLSEITPPTSEVCPNNIQVTTSTAITEIQKPKVIFRTGDGREAPHQCDFFGDKASYNFTIGLHTIVCRAFDPVFGDQAVTLCEFTIKIKRE